ncbi:hypothetical protein KFZ70_03720 [Tamlana fucoidanivorans]|uniref:Rieske domain-containing protein n=1 Tax=Allotamlana fucoidanivorans TaxID=2583814 RepID=A0A5C4SK59_9FLAO|nr:hypothetical protein [Tamlana fucoidanivorans]TNJ44199.1 hypothetical protein FGF67_09200 [Tamlana fucoidanivorans]
MKYLFPLIFLITLFSCSKNSDDNRNCNFLLDVDVNTSINLTLPEYSQLQFPNNPVYISNAGNGGVIVNNTGSSYIAFDAADPNHIFENCSVLKINGINAICGCEDKNEYNLLNGLAVNNGNLRCPLKQYRVEPSGNNLLIFN